MFGETDRHLRELQQSFQDIGGLARQVLSPEEHADLSGKIAGITHNLEEIRDQAGTGLSEAEKTYHFLTVFDDTVFIRSMLNRVEAAASSMAEEATAQSLLG